MKIKKSLSNAKSESNKFANNDFTSSDFAVKKKLAPEKLTLPSRFIYAADVPEVKDLRSKFIYNFYVPNECILDEDILSDATIASMNLSQNIISKNRSEFSDNDLSINRSKLPRYVKIEFSPPSTQKIPYATQQQSSVLSQNFSKILKEESFSTNFFSSLLFDNNELESQTNILFNEDKYSGVSEKSSEDSLLQQNLSQQDFEKNTIFKNGKGKIIGNSYLEKFRTLTTSIQVNNAILHDLVISSAGNPLTLNSEKFKQYIPDSKKISPLFNDYKISQSDYETSVDYYKIISKADTNEHAQYKLVGYYIEKKELRLDGSLKQFDPIIIENAAANSYIDFDVRYGTTYIYEIRSVADVTYPAVNNEEYTVHMISSLIASKAKRTFVETTENVEPPPPIEVMPIWDYDKINPNTMEYDQVTENPYPNTGKRGSLMITWSFPVNSQMDIKKFQVFRRKSVDEPFELLKIFDFNDADIRFPLLEDKTNKNVIEYSADPLRIYYDYDFYKESEYIYALASIDAHGLSSNYSEQFAVKFDQYSNKLLVKYISKAGAPKQYPNLHLEKDLFIDTIKSSSKNTVHMYLNPDCYSVGLNSGTVLDMLKSNKHNAKYIMNFINVENQKNAAVEINITDLRSQVNKSKIPTTEDGQLDFSDVDVKTYENHYDNPSNSELINNSKIKEKIKINKLPKKIHKNFV